MITGLLTLGGVVIGAVIAGGLSRGLTDDEIRALFPTVSNKTPPTVAEINR